MDLTFHFDKTPRPHIIFVTTQSLPHRHNGKSGIDCLAEEQVRDVVESVLHAGFPDGSVMSFHCGAFRTEPHFHGHVCVTLDEAAQWVMMETPPHGILPYSAQAQTGRSREEYIEGMRANALIQEAKGRKYYEQDCSFDSVDLGAVGDGMVAGAAKLGLDLIFHSCEAKVAVVPKEPISTTLLLARARDLLEALGIFSSDSTGAHLCMRLGTTWGRYATLGDADEAFGRSHVYIHMTPVDIYYHNPDRAAWRTRFLDAHTHSRCHLFLT